MNPETIILLGTIFADIALLGASLFVLSYALFFNWRSTLAGRSIMGFVSSLVLLSLVGWVYRNFGELPTYGIIRVVIMATVAASAWLLLIALWKTWMKNEPPHGVEPSRLYTPSVEEVTHMSNNDKIIGTIRTAVPGAIGVFIAWLIGKVPAVADYLAATDRLLAESGFAGATAQGILTALVTGAIIAIYYRLVRWAGDRWPMVERYLLGSSKSPVYFQPADARIVEDAIPVPAEREAEQTAGNSVVVEENREGLTR